MSLYKLLFLMKRAFSGMKRRPFLHLFSLITLIATFLSFATTLTAAVNLNQLIQRWVGTAQLTVYINEGVPEADVEKLVTAIRETPFVAGVETTSPETARGRFAEEMGQYRDMVRSLPESAFPASIEVHLTDAAAASKKTRAALAARIAEVKMVEQVDQYDDWFERLNAIAVMGRASAWGIGLLSLVVAVLVVGAVVKSGVSSRVREIEVLGLLGATNRSIRFPFELEGAVEAAVAMVIAVLALQFLSGYVQGMLRDILPVLGMGTLSGLGFKTTLLLIAGSILAGLMGARLSMKGMVGA